MKKLLIFLVLMALVLAGCNGEDENQVRSFDGVKISYDVQNNRGQSIELPRNRWLWGC